MKDIYIRAFRAIDDRDSSMKFVDGHKRVLDNVGVTEVTSSNYEWIDNPSVYVILIESGDRTKVYGGARVHLVDGKTPLPVEEATKEIDPKIVDMVKTSALEGAGEICGLWKIGRAWGRGWRLWKGVGGVGGESRVEESR